MVHRIHVHAMANLEPRDDHWAVRVPTVPGIVYGDTPESAMDRAKFATGVFLKAYCHKFGADAVQTYLNGRGVSCFIESEDKDSKRASVASFEALVNA